jgi:DNA repair exonuclease SbcCD ATPase subunit
MDITTELKQFDITDTAIAELKDRYMGLTIKGLDDKEGFQQVHTARMDIVKRRTSVTKTGKDMRAEANAYNKAVLDEEKRILKLLEPIETHLDAEEGRITEEKARIKREAAEAEEKRILDKQMRLFDLGMTWNGTAYTVLTFALTAEQIAEATDEQLDAFCEKVTAGIKADAEYKAELQRLEDIEKKRLQEIADQQAAERKKLDDEKATLEAEKRKIQEENAKAVRAQELENARTEAAEKARKEEAERIEREAKEKAEAEKKLEAARKRKEDRKPDKERLEHLGLAIVGMVFPTMKTSEGQEIMDWFNQEIVKLTKELKKKAEAL